MGPLNLFAHLIRHFTDDPFLEAQREAIINDSPFRRQFQFACSSRLSGLDKALIEELVTLTLGQKHVAQGGRVLGMCRL